MQNFGQVGVPHIKIDKAPDAGFRLEQPGHFLSSSGPLHPGHTDRAFFRDGLGGKSLIEASANGIVLYLPYNCELARPGTPNGIDALIAAHHAHAGGESCILHADPDLYISQRGGTDSQIARTVKTCLVLGACVNTLPSVAEHTSSQITGSRGKPEDCFPLDPRQTSCSRNVDLIIRRYSSPARS
jgi:hypothetical protein